MLPRCHQCAVLIWATDGPADRAVPAHVKAASATQCTPSAYTCQYTKQLCIQKPAALLRTM